MADRLGQDETADLLATDFGIGDPDLADQVHEATAGVRELVLRSGETLRHATAPRLEVLREPDSPLATYIEREVLSPLGPQARRLLADVKDLAPVTESLCRAIGYEDADAVLSLLSRAAIIVDKAVVPVVAQALPASEGGARIASVAARWYEKHGFLVSAVRAFALGGEEVEWTRVLDSHGGSLLSAGHARLIIDVLTRVPAPSRSRYQQLLLGDALMLSGDVMGAGHTYAVIADSEPEWDAGIAWRMGRVHYMRADWRAALKSFARGKEDRSSPADVALLLAWKATAHLQLGENDMATELARRATGIAASADDDSALATAYVNLALCLLMSDDQIGADELFAQALTIATRAGDVALRARILTNQTYQLLNEARYAEALRTARLTQQCASAASYLSMRSIGLCNEGDALTMLGRFDEAIRQYERAISLCRRIGSRRSAAAHLGLGEVYRRRGWLEQARGGYEAAARLAEEGGNLQVQVCALAGLARVLVADEPKAALAAAEQATEMATSKVEVAALVARGWVAWRLGEPAADFATEAARIARAEKDRAGLAEALELRAATESDPRRIRAGLREAHGIWAAAQATVEAARVLCQLGHLQDADTDDRLAALLAAETLTRADATGPARADSEVEIRAFGRFEVCVAGQVVPATQWQSRKARDLLRILVARRGRPVPRGELCELLWPDDDPFKTGHRLSVLLSIVRTALDPQRLFATDHYLVADQSCIGLDLARVLVDVERFLADVLHGRRLRDRGAQAQARTLLESAQRSYCAEVFADEPYAEWATALREEARAAYIATLRTLAQLSEPGPAVDYLLRLLSIDPYDEAGHRALVEALVAGGQHGEARRAHSRYTEAMRAIGVRPAFQCQDPM